MARRLLLLSARWTEKCMLDILPRGQSCVKRIYSTNISFLPLRSLPPYVLLLRLLLFDEFQWFFIPYIFLVTLLVYIYIYILILCNILHRYKLFDLKNIFILLTYVFFIIYLHLINNMLCVFNLLISVQLEILRNFSSHWETALFFIHCKIIKNKIDSKKSILICIFMYFIAVGN